MREATLEAINQGSFEEARALIAGISDIESAAHLEALCFHDYLYIREPSKPEAEYYIAQASHSSIKDALVEVYARYRHFQNIFQGGTV